MKTHWGGVGIGELTNQDSIESKAGFRGSPEMSEKFRLIFGTELPEGAHWRGTKIVVGRVIYIILRKKIDGFNTFFHEMISIL